MAVTYRMIDTNTSDEAFKSIIIKYFDDFKKFMKVPNLQCPPINLVDKFDDLTCAHVKNGVLEVSKLYFIALNQGAVPVLYHEFTHVYDDSVIKPTNDLEKFGLLTYTEFHATIVQSMVASGYTTYYKDKKTASNGKFVDMFDNCTITEYFEKLNNINRKISIDTANIKTSFKSAYYQMLYYFGRMYFAEKYVTDKVSVSLDVFLSIFGENIIILKDLLFRNDNSNLMLLQLGKIQEQIIQEFDSKYNSISIN